MRFRRMNIHGDTSTSTSARRCSILVWVMWSSVAADASSFRKSLYNYSSTDTRIEAVHAPVAVTPQRPVAHPASGTMTLMIASIGSNHISRQFAWKLRRGDYFAWSFSSPIAFNEGLTAAPSVAQGHTFRPQSLAPRPLAGFTGHMHPTLPPITAGDHQQNVSRGWDKKMITYA